MTRLPLTALFLLAASCSDSDPSAVDKTCSAAWTAEYPNFTIGKCSAACVEPVKAAPGTSCLVEETVNGQPELTECNSVIGTVVTDGGDPVCCQLRPDGAGATNIVAVQCE